MDKKEQEEEIISESSEYSPKSEFSKAKVVEQALQRCIVSRGQEMKTGYYNYKFDKEKNPIKIYIPDSIQIYIGSVIALRTILTPEIMKKEKIKDKLKTLDEKYKTLFDLCSYAEQEQSLNTDNRIEWKKTGRVFIPEIDSKVVVIRLRTNFADEKQGAWNNKVRYFWNENLKLHDEMFAILNELIDKLNYFKSAVNF